MVLWCLLGYVLVHLGYEFFVWLVEVLEIYFYFLCCMQDLMAMYAHNICGRDFYLIVVCELFWSSRGIHNVYISSSNNKFWMSSSGGWDGACFRGRVASWRVALLVPSLFIT